MGRVMETQKQHGASAIMTDTNSAHEMAGTYNRNVFKLFIQLIRVKQWIKNGFVFVPLLLLFALPSLGQIRNCILGAFLFCLISSAVYIMNDIVDVEKDRTHPVKKMRPIASGVISVGVAYILLGCLLAGALLAAFLFDKTVAFLLACYFVMNIAYSFFLKKIMYVDVFTISMGFLIRVGVGFRVLHLSMDDTVNLWFAVFVVFLTLFIGMGKRHNELKMLGGDSSDFRQSLSECSMEQLDQIMNILMTCTIMSYTMFVFQTQRPLLFITLPLLLYSIFRYHFLENKTDLLGSPEMIIYKDAPIRWCILLWAVLLVGICVGQAYFM